MTNYNFSSESRKTIEKKIKNYMYMYLKNTLFNWYDPELFWGFFFQKKVLFYILVLK